MLKGCLGVIAMLWGVGNNLSAAKNSREERPKDCASLISDLKNMQSAQEQILNTYVKRNTLIGEVFESNASKLENSVNTESSKKAAVNNLRNASEAYRNHEAKEKDLTQRFTTASRSLLALVEVCLKNQNEEELSNQKNAE